MFSKIKITALLACAFLAGCGGGGGQNGDTPAFGQSSAKIEILPLVPSLPSNRANFPVEINSPYYTQVNVKVRDANDREPPGLTIVALRTSDVRVLGVSSSLGGYSALTCTGTSAGGFATFYIASGAVAGTAQLTASVADPLTSGSISETTCTTTTTGGARDVSTTISYTVTVGPEPFRRLEPRAARTTLPVNTFLAVNDSPAAPFVTAVDISRRDAAGNLLSGPVGRTTAMVTRPDLLQLSVADDPATPANEFTQLASTVSVDPTAGRGVVYVHSRNRAGTASVIFTTVDNLTGATITEEVVFTIGGTVAPSLAQLSITTPGGPLYVQASGGATTSPIQVALISDSGEPLVDSAGGVNNLLLEVVNPAGETLVATNAMNAQVEGAAIRVRSTQGIVNAVIRSGTRQGIIQVRVTGDRADNNVDNGIQSPITQIRSIVISDGKLFDLEITSPDVNGINVNRVSPAVVVPGAPAAIPSIPPDPNGTYSLTVSALATDRQGNPVLPNTIIEFGLIDAPALGYPEQGAGTFLIQGNDGNPREGGTTFTAATGQFTTAGGGAGPGDTLIVFGEQDPANRDLESARTVARINSPSSLDVAANMRFNLNDDSTGNGVAVDRGPVLPYVIGRATFANIATNRTTNTQGVASTTLTYPNSQLGRAAIIWARGIGDTPAGQTTPELVTDAENIVYPGAAIAGTPATLTAAPSPIAASRSQTVRICFRDSVGSPIAGTFINFNFVQAAGTVDGRSTPGVVARPTGADGCTTADVRATIVSGGVGGGTAAQVVFSVGGLRAPVDIVVFAGNRLFAIPSTLGGGGGFVVLRLVDVNGTPIPGVQVFGTCGAAGGGGGAGTPNTTPPSISVQPGRTDANGETTSVIAAQLNGVNAAATGSCTFTALDASAVVTLQGIDVCLANFSPRPAGCTATTPVPPLSMTVIMRGTDGNGYPDPAGAVLVEGSVGGLICRDGVSTGPGLPSKCNVMVPDGTAITLIASVPPSAGGGLPVPKFCRWVGEDDCASTSPVVTVSVSRNKTCNAVFATSQDANCGNP